MRDHANWYNQKHGTNAINASGWHWWIFSVWKTVYTDKVAWAFLITPGKWSMQVSIRKYY